MTLLQLYIDDSNKLFQEPERRGTQKGNEIGIFRGRHNAAMNSLFNFDQKEIAHRSDISYAFLRKLRTEKAFKDLIDVYRFDFLEKYVSPYLFQDKVIRNHILMFATDVSKYATIPSCLDCVFDDSDTYAPELKVTIAKQIIYTFEHEGIEKCLGSTEKIEALLTKWNEPDLNKRVFLSLIRLGQPIINAILQDADPTDEERNNAVNCTNLIYRVAHTL